LTAQPRSILSPVMNPAQMLFALVASRDGCDSIDYGRLRPRGGSRPSSRANEDPVSMPGRYAPEPGRVTLVIHHFGTAAAVFFSRASAAVLGSAPGQAGPQTEPSRGAAVRLGYPLPSPSRFFGRRDGTPRLRASTASCPCRKRLHRARARPLRVS